MTKGRGQARAPVSRLSTVGNTGCQMPLCVIVWDTATFARPPTQIRARRRALFDFVGRADGLWPSPKNRPAPTPFETALTILSDSGVTQILVQFWNASARRYAEEL
jgi:hypothetical protein